MNCPDCGQPMLPPGKAKRPNEYDHASGCPRLAGFLYVIGGPAADQQFLPGRELKPGERVNLGSGQEETGEGCYRFDGQLIVWRKDPPTPRGKLRPHFRRRKW